MKKIINGVLALMLSVFMFSCEETETKIEMSSYLSINDTKHELSNGLISFQGKHYDSVHYHYQIELYSNGISQIEIDSDSGKYRDTKGAGNWIDLEIITRSVGNLEGTYAIGRYDAIYLTDFNFSDWGTSTNDSTLEYTYIGSANNPDSYINIEEEGEQYVISFKFVDLQTRTISGFFKGRLDYYDATDYWP